MLETFYKIYENIPGGNCIIADSLAEVKELTGFGGDEVKNLMYRRTAKNADFSVFKYN